MAELLYRVGRFAARRGWAVIAVWAAVFAASTSAYLVVGGSLGSTVTIPDTPTSRVTERLSERFPQAGGGTASIVFHTRDGAPLTAGQQAAISAAVARAGAVEGVEAVVDPFATEQQRAEKEQEVRRGQEQITTQRAALDASQTRLDTARQQAEAAGRLAQMRAELATQQAQIDEGRAALQRSGEQLELGAAQLRMAQEYRTVSADGSTAVAMVSFSEPAAEVPVAVKEDLRATIESAPLDGVLAEYSSELMLDITGLVGASEVVGVVVAALVLIVMLGTLIAAGLPVLTALVGVGIGALGSMALSSVVDMVTVTPVLGTMLGLAVGIDYALFILNRHRRQLRAGVDLHESIGLANGTSGNAVVFAGMTVLIALLALNVTRIPFLGLMGSVAAVCVAIAVLIAVTLTPALLGLIGPRLLRRSEREAPAVSNGSPQPMRTSTAVLRIVAAVAVLGLVAIPAASMRLGLPDGGSEPPGSTQHEAYTLISEKFGAGQNGPLVVVADLPTGLDEARVTAAQVAIGQQIADRDDVAAVVPVGVSSDGSIAAYQVIPVHGPSSSSTDDLVHELRDLDADGADGRLGVAGLASANIDISDKLGDALPRYLGVVVGLSILIMIVVFRSLLVPLIATAGFVLSVFGALGGVVAIYQWGWLGSAFAVHTPGPVLNFLPTVLIGVLFGLAMDYQLFLVSGMREAYAHGDSSRVAVRHGLDAARAVVTAAAIIMISVFSGFIFSHLAMVRPIGFGLALGVLLDAFVVRIMLIPALMHLLGDKAWWIPRWLDRILPHVDIEGTALERWHHLAPEAPELTRNRA